ncbi:MAG: hydantoinase/oxoprolinase family protein [Spirochaetes bacterium]|nr:hydantoinase/oxoprolinase family protein [Spirochaetota bacterium]
MKTKMRIGVDIGGTFTDCVVIDENSVIHRFKELSTPKDPSVGLYNVIKKASKYFNKSLTELLSSLDLFCHGTTVATNTLLTGTGARTGLVLTKGFRDSIEMRRAHKDNIWDLRLPVPPPLVPRYLRLGVTERVDHRGEVLQPLDADDAESVCRTFKREGVEAVAVCTLFSFLNDSHERAIREIVAKHLPDAFISISSEVLPQIREYERQSTTVANAYVGPKLTVYLSNLETRLKSDGLSRAFYVTASNGGVMTVDTAIRHASATLLSGPAAGAVGAMFFADLLGQKNLILMDMGGTSFDVTLVNNGNVTLSTEGEIAGYRIAKPMIDINTIGAGGGSIAWIDRGGMLRVGPASAGSDPGPVCYDLGGEKPTVTDANLLLGYLNPDYFLGGEMQVNKEKAKKILQKTVADPMGLCEVEAAAGIFRIINQSMADATKVVSIQRGHDPREYALISAGGACSIHACKIAEEVGSRTVIVPEAASVFCALGMLESDIRLDSVKTFNGFIPGLDLAEFNEVIAQVEKKALAELLQEGVERERATLVRHLDIRYVGQHHEVTVEIPSEGAIESRHLDEIADAFHNAHERLYTYSTPENPLEVMNLRITAIGSVEKTGLKNASKKKASVEEALKGKRPVYFEETGGFIDTPVYDRNLLSEGARIEGPAVVEERITTVIVHPEWNLTVDTYGNIIMKEKT